MQPARNDGTAAEEAFETLIKADVLYRFPDQKMLRGLNRGRAVGDFPKPSGDRRALHQAP